MKRLLLALALAGAMGCEAGLEADYQDPAENAAPTDELETYEDVDRGLESAGDSLDNLGAYPEGEREPVE